MPKINGTFLQLHKKTNTYPPPEYYNTLEFGETISLADCVDKGNSAGTVSYKFSSIDEVRRLIGTADPQNKLFLVESNSAHHMSAFLVQRAFDGMERDSEGKITGALVVNFDQHEDHGKPNSEFYCGSWGGHVNSDYLVVGLFSRQEAHLYNYGANGYKNFPLKKCTDIYKSYSKIYVTVDMDVLNGGKSRRTNWKHGAMSKDILLRLLNDLPGDKLVAADVTGFPPYIQNEGTRNESLGELNTYLSDITETAETLCRLMGIQPYTDN